MNLSTMEDWLTFITSFPGPDINLGLERVQEVGEILSVLNPSATVITVAGTNGKGSTVAMLEAIYLAAGFKVATFTSPVLLRHNEQVHLNGKEASDEAFCEAFAAVNRARGEITLTPFEFHTLAAFYIFSQVEWDILILEVGLGGRWDAVNVIDPSVAIVTSISLDHTALLGETREAIAIEKAGIFRKAKPAICGDPNPPASLIAAAKEIGANFLCQGKDFSYQTQSKTWRWTTNDASYEQLPFNGLYLQNLATALMAVHLLQAQFSVSPVAIRQGLQLVKLKARIQIQPTAHGTEIYDVAHNPAACEHLATQLKAMNIMGKVVAVFSMLADKDILASIKVLKPVISEWVVAPISHQRGAKLDQLQKAFVEAKIAKVTFCHDLASAYRNARERVVEGDVLLVCGSFHTVAAAWST